ncbi:hypothetical protein [Vibrio harveyi]|uniref:hypothetical protein n=1 Tax=Vibrio harveyi TaxID=669 RepID=UPI003CF6918F
MKLSNQSIHLAMENSYFESWCHQEENSSVWNEGCQRIEYIERYFLKKYLEQYGINSKDLELRFCPPVDEICIYIKGRWSGYFDSELIDCLNSDSAHLAA